jgi:hypothetical protein
MATPPISLAYLKIRVDVPDGESEGSGYFTIIDAEDDEGDEIQLSDRLTERQFVDREACVQAVCEEVVRAVRVNVGTWNFGPLHGKCSGPTARAFFEAVPELPPSLETLDLLFLQEVREPAVRVFVEELTTRTNKQWCKLACEGDAAILSVHPGEEVNSDLLRWGKAKLPSMLGTIFLHSVHVRVNDPERLLQRLNQSIKQACCTIVGGDFNTRQEQVQSVLDPVTFFNNRHTRTTTDVRKRGAIDHIAASTPYFRDCGKGVEVPQVPAHPNHHLVWATLGLTNAIRELFIDVELVGEDGLNEVPYGTLAADEYTTVYD